MRTLKPGSRRAGRTGRAVVRPEGEWRDRLTPQQYSVLREGGTERAGSGEYVYTTDRGTYRCAACHPHLFDASDKYDSGTGWPSFTRPAQDEAVEHVRDVGLLGIRTEVRCRSARRTLGTCSRTAHRPKAPGTA